MNVLLVSIFTKKIVYGEGRLGNLMKWLPSDTKYTLLTSDFDHRKKMYCCTNQSSQNDNVTTEYIHVPSYSRNLSILRIWGNFKFGRGVKRFLNSASKEFDLIYCIVPSASGVLGCRPYLHSHRNTKLVVDVMDLLPESLIPILGNNIFIKTILSPWFYISKKAYRTAHFITGESKEYANIAHRCNPAVPFTYTYLGIDMSQLDNYKKRNKNLLPVDGSIKICYGGNLGNSYDFDAIIKALSLLHSTGINYSMFFVGGGDKEDYVREKINETGIKATVTGIVSYEEYIEYLSQCDIGLNIFKANTKIVHSYKFNDYAACSLFIINNLHGETESMIQQYDCGVTSDDIAETLVEICSSWDNLKSKKANSLKLANAELNADVIYKKQTEKILSILSFQK